MNKLIPILILFAACSPKNDNIEDDTIKSVNTNIVGKWVRDTETLIISEDVFEYRHSIGSANEGTFSGKIVELDSKNGFIAGEINTAKVNGVDVSLAFEGDYSIFYFTELRSGSIEIDCPQGAVLSGLENIHRNDSTDHFYDIFTKE